MEDRERERATNHKESEDIFSVNKETEVISLNKADM